MRPQNTFPFAPRQEKNPISLGRLGGGEKDTFVLPLIASNTLERSITILEFWSNSIFGTEDMVFSPHSTCKKPRASTVT